MTCKHCGAMRRADGGIKIGGRVTLTMLPGCPCSTLLRIPDDELYTIIDLELNLIPGNYGAGHSQMLRFCPAMVGNVTPKITSLTCSNYVIEDYTSDASIQCAYGVTEACSQNPTPGVISSAFMFDGVPTDGVPFDTSTPGRWFACQLFVDFFDWTFDPLPFAPIVTISYKFER